MTYVGAFRMKNGYLNFICHLTGIFIMCMFLTGKMAFDGHDTRQILALLPLLLLFFIIFEAVDRCSADVFGVLQIETKPSPVLYA